MGSSLQPLTVTKPRWGRARRIVVSRPVIGWAVIRVSTCFGDFTVFLSAVRLPLAIACLLVAS